MEAQLKTVMERIETLREDMQINSSRFSMAIGMSAATYHRYKTGVNSPSLELVLRVLNTYPTVSADWLLQGVGHPISEERSNAPVANGTPSANNGDCNTLLRTIITLQQVIDEQQDMIRVLKGE